MGAHLSSYELLVALLLFISSLHDLSPKDLLIIDNLDLQLLILLLKLEILLLQLPDLIVNLHMLPPLLFPLPGLYLK